MKNGYPGFGYPRVVFLILSFHFVNKNLVSFKFCIVIILLTLCAHTHLVYIRSHSNFSNSIILLVFDLIYVIFFFFVLFCCCRSFTHLLKKNPSTKGVG
jgi:hypothetical protein